MKFGDAFYCFTTIPIEFPNPKFPTQKEQIFIPAIEKVYYIADVIYFNNIKAIELCSRSIDDIEKNNNGKWYGSKREVYLENLDSKIERYRSFYSSLEMARAAAKDFYTKDEIKTSKSGIKIYYLDNPELKDQVFSII